MAPYFETVKSFADVPVTSDGVDTLQFLEAADGLVTLFDLLGSSVFAFVQHDMQGNISGLRERHGQHPPRSNTLQALVESEKSDGHGYACGCLVRLVRALTFTHIALEHTLANPSTPLHLSFRHAYDEVLKKHHGWGVRGVIYIALRSTPTRPVFLARLSQAPPDQGPPAHFEPALERWLEGLGKVVQGVRAWLEDGGWGRI
ncbi:hypothetical protein PLICRDRAFT_93649 [Plicaturopsis crispa FD-325 SS-3]|nr:hypothetical protein PLICRDRAFT_93649 [Plicaturopsis crispa FD-325 SS-3]